MNYCNIKEGLSLTFWWQLSVQIWSGSESIIRIRSRQFSSHPDGSGTFTLLESTIRASDGGSKTTTTKKAKLAWCGDHRVGFGYRPPALVSLSAKRQMKQIKCRVRRPTSGLAAKGIAILTLDRLLWLFVDCNRGLQFILNPPSLPSGFSFSKKTNKLNTRSWRKKTHKWISCKGISELPVLFLHFTDFFGYL